MRDLKKIYSTGPLASQLTIKATIFVITTVILIGFAFFLLIFAQNRMRVEFTIMAIGVLPLLLAIELNRRNHTQSAGAVMAISLLLMVTMLATFGSGIYSTGVMAYPAILIIGGLVMRRTSILYLTLIAITCIAWLIFGGAFGFYRVEYPHEIYIRQFFFVTLILQSPCNTNWMNASGSKQRYARLKNCIEILSKIHQSSPIAVLLNCTV
jgi:hypothetical protein